MTELSYEEKTPPQDAPRPSVVRPAARRLPTAVQWTVVGAMAGVSLLGVLLVIGIGAATETAEATTAPAAAEAQGTFRPTAAQLAGLKIAPVTSRSFRTEQVTDGQIAIADDRQTPVFSPYSGRVTRLIAAPGEVVKAGQPLFAIDASEFVQGQNDLSTALANLNAARVQLTVAEEAEKRQHALYDAEAAALKDWQQSQVDLATARGGYRSAEIALAAVRNRLHILGKSATDIAQMEKSAALSAEALVVAPIGGVVTDRQLGIGQYIQSGASSPQYTIGDLSKVWLVANVREVDAPQVSIGQAVEVRVLAYPGRVFTARVTYVGPAVDPNTRRVPVRAEIDNSDHALKPQMFASFTIITTAAANGVGVPESAVIYEGSDARLWVARGDGAIELRPVKTGRINDGIVEVTQGLTAAEQVVTSGALFIDRAAQGD